MYNVLTLTMCLWKDLVTEGRLFFLVKMAGPPSFDASYELHVKTHTCKKFSLNSSPPFIWTKDALAKRAQSNSTHICPYCLQQHSNMLRLSRLDWVDVAGWAKVFLRRKVGLSRRARGITLLLLQLFVSDVNNSPCFVRKCMKRRFAQGSLSWRAILSSWDNFSSYTSKSGLNSFKYKTYQCTGYWHTHVTSTHIEKGPGSD